MLTATADGLLHDGGRVFGPDERGRMAVPVGDVSLDVANQRTDGIERAAPDRLTRQNAEPGFDHVEPGRALGREVKFDVGMLREPGVDRWCRMGGGVVEDDVQFAATVATGESLHEAQEIGAGVPRGALADDPAARDLEGRIQARQALYVASSESVAPAAHRRMLTT